MRCNDCPYYWNDADFDDDAYDFTYCHYRWNDGEAPCEYDDNAFILTEAM